ncbi:DUF4272 domain-containing protein [Phaeovibrio sulfidiphilus]|uniref:DUF4272 domain-containing protein n=1 Tax=Phaeovibrio sulfidiphilus TaxID=1220600 RepID=A0A8J7CWJ0_9PROT|nr:DUF4272 domain-containing protein [Phaeovibrio sulfidiphilus]MBE1237546.1 DUF4272 domain-containing protein [Phaeovibrio sulfidiphilus]
MEQCTLFLTVPTPSALFDMIEDALPAHTLSIDPEDGQILATAETGPGAVFRVIDIKRETDHFHRLITTLVRLVGSVTTPREPVRAGLLGHLRSLTTVVVATAEPPRDTLDETLVSRLTDMGARADGLLLTPKGEFLTGQGTLVLNLAGESDLQVYRPPDPPGQRPSTVVDVLELNEARRDRSHRTLAARGIPVCPSLPPIVGDDQVRLRTCEEVVRRSLGILITSVYGEFVRDECVEIAREQILTPIFPDDPDHDPDVISPFGLKTAWEVMTPRELAFLARDDVTDQDVATYVWRYECYWTALWALGFVPRLDYPDHICDVPGMLGFLRDAGSLAAFARQARLRSPREILDQADLIYRYDWACVEATLHGTPPPAGLEPGVVRERHRMLNWLTCYRNQDWDDVTTDT